MHKVYSIEITRRYARTWTVVPKQAWSCVRITGAVPPPVVCICTCSSIKLLAYRAGFLHEVSCETAGATDES
jgi:hypothetical protein